MKKVFLYYVLAYFAGISNINAFDNSVFINGFISQGYLKTENNGYLGDTEDGTFNFNEMGLNISTSPISRLRFGMQLFARDIGDFGNDELIIDWVYAEYTYRNWLGFTAGKTKILVGLYNQARDIDVARTAILLPTSLYNEFWRDGMTALKGFGIDGRTSFSISDVYLGRITYYINLGTIDAEVDTGLVKAYTDPASDVVGSTVVPVRSNIKDSINIYLEWDLPVNGLKIVGSFLSYDLLIDTLMFSSVMADFDTTTDIKSVSVEYIRGGLKISSEYFESENKAKIISSFFQPINRIFLTQGYYTSMYYNFSQFFECGFYYSEYYLDKNDKDGKEYAVTYDAPRASVWLKDFALSFRLNISFNWIFKLEIHRLYGLAGGVVYGPDNPEEDWWLYASKVTYSF